MNKQEERENTIEFTAHSENEDVGKLYYSACDILEERFKTTGTFKVTIVFIPDGEENE